MQHDTDLQRALQQHLPLNRARVKFMALFISVLLKLTTVNWTKLANGLNGRAQKQSNYRRIQRFFADFDLQQNLIAPLVLSLLPIKSGFVVSMDRTNWEFGSVSINFLMASIVYEGTAFPIYWMALDKRGNSSTEERKVLLEKVLEILDRRDIAALVADREFIGQRWFQWLDGQALLFVIRIRKNALVPTGTGEKTVEALFSDLKVGQRRLLRKPRRVYGNRLWLSGLRLEDDAHGVPCFLIVVTNRRGRQALATYRLRWGIEVLFAALKSRGFDFEATHVSDPERLEKYVGLLAIAFAWAHRVGQWLNEATPLKLKRHGRKEKSLFRYGLDHLQYILLNLFDQWEAFQDVLRLLEKPSLQTKTGPL
jgi:hypothetical protein